ncbi:hypothetical protein [Saccharopolyspora sp. ASAGF58]|uniref:hypothetical protein n=1 Tax=Saccharopolyspora sp. ASAGF58 TaxID=2719023 RepID=UPI00144643D0|nr:hypothetical protein [Saccharopolyspora sp. ASAGF58]
MATSTQYPGASAPQHVRADEAIDIDLSGNGRPGCFAINAAIERASSDPTEGRGGPELRAVE